MLWRNSLQLEVWDEQGKQAKAQAEASLQWEQWTNQCDLLRDYQTLLWDGSQDNCEVYA